MPKTPIPDIIFPVTIQDIFFKNKTEENYRNVSLKTETGSIETRYYAAIGAKKAVIFIGDAEGGFDSPAKYLYPKLASELKKQKISSLQIKYRNSQDIDNSVYDVLTGLSFLQSQKCQYIAIVGYSFGAAVAIRAAIVDSHVTTVITLAAQCFGANQVAEFASRCSILLIHGSKDSMFPLNFSEQIFSLAGQPKKLLIYTAGHFLDECAEQVFDNVKDWLMRDSNLPA